MKESNTTAVTVVAQTENKQEFVVKQYTSSDKTATKVNEQIIRTCDVVHPKPIVTAPVAPTIIKEVAILESEVKKVLKVSTSSTLEMTQISSVTVSQNTNVQVYHVKATDNEDKEVDIEIVYNPTTEEAIVTDVE